MEFKWTEMEGKEVSKCLQANAADVLQDLLLSADRLASKETAIKTIESLFGSVKVSKGDVNLAGRVLFDMDTLYGSVLGLTFVFDVVSEIFVPIGFGFSVKDQGSG